MLQHNGSPPAASLDDDALTRKVVSLAGNEREALVDFLHHLGEFDARRLYLAQGYASLFEYCSDFLRLSNGTAHRRYTTARLMRRFPLIAEFLRSGRLNTKRVALLRDVLTEKNHAEVLELATHGTEKDVERLVASLNPKPDVADGIRKLPSPRPLPAVASLAPMTAAPSPLGSTGAESPAMGSSTPLNPAVGSPTCAPPPPPSASSSSASTKLTSPTATAHPLLETVGADTQPMTAEPPRAPRSHRMEVEATSGTTFAVRMSVGPEFVAEFEEVKAALSHKFPNGNFEAVMRECFRITLDAVKRRRMGSARNRTAETGSASATPAPVHAAVKSASLASASTPSDVTHETRAATSAAEDLAHEPGEATTPGAGVAPAPRGATRTGADSAPEPRAAMTTKPSRYISATVRQAVWTRDDGRCAFVSKDGRRCNSNYQVEVHHIDPYALGGPATVENLSLRCRQHNRHEAEVAFGADFMRSLPLWKCEDSAVPSLQVDTTTSSVEAARGLVSGKRSTAARSPSPVDLH